MAHELRGRRHDSYSVIMDSALGLLGAPPAHKQDFLDQVAWLHEYLTKLPAPKYPFPIDAARAETGKEVFARNCAACHASARTGTPVPLAEIGTDGNRLDSWNESAAKVANKVVTTAHDPVPTPSLRGMFDRLPGAGETEGRR
jgi:mono/diheme cytochrome c family protein